jgi:hypothetical protein
VLVYLTTGGRAHVLMLFSYRDGYVHEGQSHSAASAVNSYSLFMGSQTFRKSLRYATPNRPVMPPSGRDDAVFRDPPILTYLDWR